MHAVTTNLLFTYLLALPDLCNESHAALDCIYLDSCDIGIYTYAFVSPVPGGSAFAHDSPCRPIDYHVELVFTSTVSPHHTTSTTV